jgi:hypothetical protein
MPFGGGRWVILGTIAGKMAESGRKTADLRAGAGILC